MEPTKFDPTSHTLTDDLKAKLKALLPEAFTEESIDFERLKTLLGDMTDQGQERYSFTWPGKTKAIRAAQTSSIGTLVPDKEASENWDTTDNLYLEGDNLEILKLLQKSYAGKVKMIYIDPPYNTGKDFVYPDNYGEGLKTYLEYTGQVDGEGKKITTNTETDGRYHSKWLNMMYSRLMLARNLLRQDGVIYISINDYEFANLRKIANEIFGEENSLTESPTSLIWTGSGTTAGHFASSHEYILAYAKDKSDLPFFKLEDFGDNSLILHGALKKISKVNPASPVTFPVGFKFEGDNARFSGEIGGSEKEIIEGEMVFKDGKLVKPVTITAGWAMKDSLLSWMSGEETYDTKGQKINRFYFNREGILWYEKERGTIHPKTILDKNIVGTTKTGSSEVLDLFDLKVFDYPKPTNLISYLISFTTGNNDLILDFFAGSATTAHSILKQNAEDGASRRFIMTQLQEPTPEDSEARKAGYENIALLGRERIKRAGVKIKADHADKLLERETPLDIGFRTYRLAASTFNTWDTTSEDDLQAKLMSTTSLIKNDVKDEDLLTELILKSGYGLTELVREIEIGGKKFYSVANGELFISLGTGLDESVVRLITDRTPKRFVAKETGFANDSALTNTAQIMKDKGVDFRVL